MASKKPNAPAVAFDSCVFISYMRKSEEPQRHSEVAQIVSAAKRGEFVIVSSAIAIAEVLKCDSELSGDELDAITGFFSNTYLEFRACDRMVAEMAQYIAKTHGVLPMDAIHVASARVEEVDVLYTWDNCKGRRRGILRLDGIEIDGFTLNIKTPANFAPAGTLFAPKAP
ncbi:MAG: hypothetical protein DRQ55_12715 [Planctomycetota bacterium]|nr:MAG: hypothetical protein DRQ55_12715 [Planctomycetota bacterium]RKZ06808.1 MAG: hypothetical protein DRQ32_10730 [bacterium]